MFAKHASMARGFVLGSVLWGISTMVQAATPYVAMTELMEHPSFQHIYQGIQDSLREQGFEDGKTIRIRMQSAQGNVSTAAQIARRFVGERPDVIVAISTPSAQAVVSATQTIPVVFSGVTDPVAAKLIPSWAPSGTNVTGNSNQLPLDQMLSLLAKVAPKAKRYGVIYNPGEQNSDLTVKRLTPKMEQAGLSLIKAAAVRTFDVGTAAKSLIKKVDAILIINDSTAVSAIDAIVKVANDAKIPLIAADKDSAVHGAAVAFSFNYYDMGVGAGKMIGRILRGEAPGSIAPERPKNLTLFINPEAAKKQGLEIDPEVAKSAEKIHTQK